MNPSIGSSNSKHIERTQRSQPKTRGKGAEITFAEQEADTSGNGSAQPPERLEEDYARNKLSA